MKTDECSACGSSPKDREDYVKRNNEPGLPANVFARCPHCGSEKCIMCDMGNDVRCLSCEDDSNDD